MKVELSLTKAEAMAIIRCEGLSNGHGVIKSQALLSADAKLLTAVGEAAAANIGRADGT